MQEGTNGFDPQKTKDYVRRIETMYADLDSLRGTYMVDCKIVRGDIKDVLKEAKGNGIPTKELKAAIKTRQMQRRLDGIRDDLEGEQQDNYDMIRHALGDLADTPLGEAALQAAAPTPRRRGPGRPKKDVVEQSEADARAAMTAEELAEPIDEMDRPFAERHAEQKARDGDAFRDAPIPF